MENDLIGGLAWAEIDAATFRAKGELDQIRRAMEKVLQGSTVNELCDKLGILVTSFAFQNEYNKELHFYEPLEAPPTYHTNYLFRDASNASDYADLLHEMFVDVRSLSKNYQKEVSGSKVQFRPDYQLHSPLTDTDLDARIICENEQSYRSKHLVHYCTAGETLTSCLVWRWLSILSRDLASKTNSDWRHIDLNYAVSRDRIDLRWLGQKVFQHPWHSHFREKLELHWIKQLGPMGTWASELEQLGLGEEETWGWPILQNFLSHLIGFAPSADQSRMSDFLVAYGHLIISKLVGVEIDSTTKPTEALRELESKARMPILPFYFWITLDRRPIVFCASPVWLSQFIQDDFHDGKTRIMGYAVSALKPIGSIDWTLPQDPHWLHRYSSFHEPQTVFSILRLMSKPLVESLLYKQAIRGARVNKVVHGSIQGGDSRR